MNRQHNPPDYVTPPMQPPPKPHLDYVAFSRELQDANRAAHADLAAAYRRIRQLEKALRPFAIGLTERQQSTEAISWRVPVGWIMEAQATLGEDSNQERGLDA